MFFVKTPSFVLCFSALVILGAFLVVDVDAQLCHVSFASEESEKSSVISSGSWGNITWDASFVVDMCDVATATSISSSTSAENRVQISGLIINGQHVTPFEVQQNQIVPIPDPTSSSSSSSSSLFRLLISSREIVTATPGGSSQTAVVFRLVIFSPSGAVAADICPDIFVGFLKQCASFSKIWPIVTAVGWSSFAIFAAVMAVGFARRTALMQRYEKMERDAHWQGSLGSEVMRVRIVDPHAIAEKYTSSSSTKKLKPKTERDFPPGKRRADPSSGLRSFACVHTLVDDTWSINQKEQQEHVLHFEARLMYNRGRHMKSDEPEQYCLIQLLQVIDLPNEYYLVIRSGRVGASGFSTLVHCSGEVEGIADFFSQISTKRAEDWEVIDGPVHPANFVLERMYSAEGTMHSNFVSSTSTIDHNKSVVEEKILLAPTEKNNKTCDDKQNQQSQNGPGVLEKNFNNNNENLPSVSNQQQSERDDETKKFAQQQILLQQQQQQHNDASRKIHQEQETLDRSRQEFDENQSRQILDEQHTKIGLLVAAAIVQEAEENRKKKQRHDQEEKLNQERLFQQQQQQQFERERNISNTNDDKFLQEQRQQLAKERDELAKEKLRFDQERIAHQLREEETKMQKQREQQELEHQRQDMERKKKEMEDEKQRLLLSYGASSTSGSPPAVTPRETENDDAANTMQQQEKTKSSSPSDDEESFNDEKTPNNKKNTKEVAKDSIKSGDDEDELENTFTFNLKGTKKPSTTKQRRKETKNSSMASSPNNNNTNNNNTATIRQQEARGDSLATFKSDYDEDDIRTAEPFLGFSVTVHPQEQALGPVVDAIWTNGPAHRAGIRLGDRVSHLWGRQVHTLADVKKIFAENVAVGDRMILHVHNDDIHTSDGGSDSSSSRKSETTTSLGAGTKEGHSGDEGEDEEEDEEARRYTMFMLPILTSDRRFLHNRLFFDISNSQQIFQKQ